MKRVKKLSSGIAALIVAAGMLFSSAAPAAAAAVDDPSVLATPVRLYDGASVIWSRNAWGSYYNVNLYATRLTAGNWSGYAQNNNGRKIYFCDGDDLFMNDYVVTMFISRLKASWC